MADENTFTKMDLKQLQVIHDHVTLACQQIAMAAHLLQNTGKYKEEEMRGKRTIAEAHLNQAIGYIEHLRAILPDFRNLPF